MTLYEFLNAQTGDRLFFYGLFSIIALYYICQLISNIFKYTFYRKPKDKKIIEKDTWANISK